MTTDPLVLPAQTIFGVLQNQAERHPRKVAIEFHDREITYAETAERARRFASALTRLGVSKGDKVGIMLPNLPEFLFAYYGALAAGATVVLFNVMLKPGEIEYLCSHSETKVMVVLDRLYPAAAEGIKNAPSVREMIVIGESIPQTHSFGGLIESGDPGFTPPPIDLRDLAHLIYTSGTTGKPKGAMITHFNVLSNLASMNLMRPTIESTKVLCVLPLFHAYGLISVMSGTVMRGERFSFIRASRRVR
ncbi:AMP-binding protein [Candidatus Sumerlaeota bacterium]|nr:AMP-binding protein [Candidatus Sumerlaeota bacterium]